MTGANALLVMLVGLGFFGGFLAGLVGLGGAIIMIPLVLEVPRLIGLPVLDMRVIAGIVSVQVLFSAVTGVIVHYRNGFVSKKLVTYMGTSIFIAAFIGGVISKYVQVKLLEGVFAILALIAAVMMYVPRKEFGDNTHPEQIEFNKMLASLIALVVGLNAGLVGAPGAFILVPLMMYVLKIPTRITIGSTMAIVLLSALATTGGKLLTGQIPLLLAGALIIGAVPGAHFGARISKHTPVVVLRTVLAVLISASAIKMWVRIITG